MTRYPTRWAVILLVLVSLALALRWVGPQDRFDQDAAAPTSRPSVSDRPVFSSGASAEPRSARSAPAWPTRRPSVILRRWDRQRSRAYERGDSDALSALYAAGSRAATSDVALLLDYRRRGLRVEGLRMQLLEVQVLAHAPGRWRLRVTDRVHGAVAVGAGVRVMLPRDEASTRVVTLRRTSADADWKVAAVRG